MLLVQQILRRWLRLVAQAFGIRGWHDRFQNESHPSARPFCAAVAANHSKGSRDGRTSLVGESHGIGVAGGTPCRAERALAYGHHGVAGPLSIYIFSVAAVADGLPTGLGASVAHDRS